MANDRPPRRRLLWLLVALIIATPQKLAHANRPSIPGVALPVHDCVKGARGGRPLRGTTKRIALAWLGPSARKHRFPFTGANNGAISGGSRSKAPTCFGPFATRGTRGSEEVTPTNKKGATRPCSHS